MRVTRILVAASFLLTPALASARKPILAWIDTTDTFRLYDLEAGASLGAPAFQANLRRFGVSQGGRYVVYVDKGKKVHLVDLVTQREVPLPGIDVYTNPGFPSVSDSGLIAFDDNLNGPTVLYNASIGAFVPTGFAGNNGHRQPALAGEGGFLATTCLKDCIHSTVDADSDLFLQDIPSQADIPVPDTLSGDTKRDEEHPCLSGGGRIVGADVPNPTKRDIVLFDRQAGQVATPPGFNDPASDDNFCALDFTGQYLGAFTNLQHMRILDRASNQQLPMPDPNIDRPAFLIQPEQAVPPPDRLKPRVTRVRARRNRRRRLRVTFRLSEAALVDLTLKRGRRRIPIARRRAGRAGSNTITSRRAVAAGRYTLTVFATDLAGNLGTVKKRLRVR